MNIADAKCENCGQVATYHRANDMACHMPNWDGIGTGFSPEYHWQAPPDVTATVLAPKEVSLVFVGNEPVLPTDSEERKGIPIFSGVLNYFPLAIAAMARLSKRGNYKHNPGEELHWERRKSTDHEDCIARHLIDVHTLDAKTGEYEDAVALAWRACALLQILEEKRLNKPMSRASK